jgi:FtsP/CotA-like multicopper oxidase with cupredoxin domain
VAVLAGLLLAPTLEGGSDDLLKQLREEFEGSYPLEAPQSSGVKEWTLTAAPAEVEIFDGRTLAVWSYNGQVPGPTLRVRLGQTVRVVLRNELPMPTTIHWHGVRVPNAMDGVPEVTQPPVLPGESFVYEFTPKDAGTYWFHPHVRSMEQVERGLYGLLIVEDAEPLPYSREVVWVLDDWRLTPDGSKIDPNFATRSDLTHDGRWGNVVAVNGRLQNFLDVKAGERIRLRILNAANGRVFLPDLWKLDAKLIAIDGNYVARHDVPKRLELAPNNRADLDITFPVEHAGRYVPIFDKWSRKTNRLGVIRISEETVPTPDFPAPVAPKMPRWNRAHTLEPTLEYVLDSRAGGKLGIQWTLNDVAYSPHMERQTLYYDEWAKIRFTNASSRMHPMHMHGVFFKLLSRNGAPVDEPYWRDTVLTHPRETVEIGLVPWDLGGWMLHCHILEHAASGMMTIVDVKRRGP